ncbi:zinc-binding dehydrogenase [Streptomyces tsukubensis]|uniref:NADP-dependent oxidoreductase n=1 Tax=Streptomyces tsukubensis TaxID=83656 RepID=A0A1V4A2U3_9ACTN|nr:zinc-binding dehydrogenase [Streptomyces tsukubensis]OON74195.1 hypothetical protein B1H18_25705 [Streptomyces tsukubensis]QFR95283.1 zinc-binding dehydrogenase [Streptomyces tsukubensis]
MKAITLRQYGGPEGPELTELPTPKIAPGEVLVRVKAAGVNPADWKVAALGALAGSGKLSVVVDRAFPPAEAADAWRAVQEGHTRGQTVLDIDAG